MSKVNLNCRPFNLRLKYPFGISRGSTSIAKNVLITLQFDDIVAYGEAAPSSFYGEDQNSVLEFLKAFSKNRFLDEYLTNINKLRDNLIEFDLNYCSVIKPNIFSSSARAALEIAFWDLIGKIQNKRLCEFIFSEDPFCILNGNLPKTSYTIGLDSLPLVEQKIKEAVNNGFSILKIKLGRGLEDDLSILKIIEKVAPLGLKKLRVDANGGWNLETTKKMLEILPKYNVEILEQPLPKGQLNKVASLLNNSPVEIIADEDCMLPQDIEMLAGKVNGINIKLMKAGGLLEALEMIKLAKSYNLKVMLGCMIESSCSISAAVHISPLVDYIDLDGHLLLEADPFSGLLFESGCVLPSYGFGLGISPVE